MCEWVESAWLGASLSSWVESYKTQVVTVVYILPVVRDYLF